MAPTLDVHNFEVLKEKKPGGKVFLIPSDFDHSTAVRTKFVVSNPLSGFEVLPLTQEGLNVRHSELASKLKMMPDGEKRLKRVLEIFRGKQHLILKDLEETEMDPEGKQSFRMHLESFYKVFEI